MRPLPKEVCKRKSKTVVRAAVKLKRSEPEQKFLNLMSILFLISKQPDLTGLMINY